MTLLVVEGVDTLAAVLLLEGIEHRGDVSLRDPRLIESEDGVARIGQCADRVNHLHEVVRARRESSHGQVPEIRVGDGGLATPEHDPEDVRRDVLRGPLPVQRCFDLLRAHGRQVSVHHGSKMSPVWLHGEEINHVRLRRVGVEIPRVHVAQRWGPIVGVQGAHRGLIGFPVARGTALHVRADDSLEDLDGVVRHAGADEASLPRGRSERRTRERSEDARLDGVRDAVSERGDRGGDVRGGEPSVLG